MIDELISKGKMNELVSLVVEQSRMSYFGAARQVLELARWGLAYEEILAEIEFYLRRGKESSLRRWIRRLYLWSLYRVPLSSREFHWTWHEELRAESQWDKGELEHAVRVLLGHEPQN